MIVSSESEIRANLFRELITPAKSHTTPSYSKNLYQAVAVILFRSSSTDEFVRIFLPLPSPRAAYVRFWSALAASPDLLQGVMIGYLSVQIARSPELIKGSVLAIGAISSSNTLLGMKRLDLFEIAYVFVTYVQLINPNIPGCSLFVIESESGIGNQRTQTEIDEILARIQSLIPRRCLAQTTTRHITNATAASWTFASQFIDDSA